MTRAIFTLPHPTRGKVRLIPLLAVGAATGNALEPKDVVSMVADPDAYCDAQQSNVVSAYKIGPDLTLRPISHDGMRDFELPDWEQVAAGIVVDADAVASVFMHLQEEIRRQEAVNRKKSGKRRIDPTLLATWNWNANLPVDHSKAIRDALPKALYATKGGLRGRQDVLARLAGAMRTIQDRAAGAGQPISVSELPGTKKPFFKVIRAIDPDIDVKDVTLADYAEELGWRWRQGARASEADWLKDLFRDLLN